jgi:hypothetical protein
LPSSCSPGSSPSSWLCPACGASCRISQPARRCVHVTRGRAAVAPSACGHVCCWYSHVHLCVICGSELYLTELSLGRYNSHGAFRDRRHMEGCMPSKVAASASAVCTREGWPDAR